MIDTALLRDRLCRTFCASISVHPVPVGFAISTAFSGRDGDRLGFYLVEDPDGFHLEDDGDFLSSLVAAGIPIEGAQRAGLLDAILAESGARWNRDTYEICSGSFGERDLGPRLIDFMSAMIRVRDLQNLSRDMVRSTFREDAIAALHQRYDDVADITEGVAVDKRLAEYPPDLIVRPRNGGHVGAVFLATSNEKLLEAELMQMQAEKHDIPVRTIALIEDADLHGLGKRKFQRAQNRLDATAIFRGDEEAAIRRVGWVLGMSRAA